LTCCKGSSSGAVRRLQVYVLTSRLQFRCDALGDLLRGAVFTGIRDRAAPRVAARQKFAGRPASKLEPQPSNTGNTALYIQCPATAIEQRLLQNCCSSTAVLSR